MPAVGFERSRHFAWRNAVLLADAPSWLATRYVDWRTRTLATGVASAILVPGIDATVAERLRDIEAEGSTLSSFDTALRRRARASVAVL